MKYQASEKTSNIEKQDLPKGWVWTKLAEVCLEPQYGWTTSAVNIGKLHLLRTTDITSGSIDWDSVPFCKEEPPEKEKYLLKDGDVVISRAGSVGYSDLIKKPKEAVFASYLIRFKPLINEQYLVYFLKSPSYWYSISEKSLGIAIPNVNASKLKQIFLPLPPLPEQHRIVAKIEEVFTELDAGVEALKKIKAQLKRYRQAVLKYAFEGKLTEEWRGNVGADLAVAQNNAMTTNKGQGQALPLQKDLPELPEGWVWTRIRDISDNIHYGYTASASEEKVGPKLLRITDIQNNSVNWDTVPYCEIDESEKQKYLLRDGDLVFARTGATVGKSFLIVGKIPESVFASYLIRIILNNNINKKFIYSFFQSINYWRQISKGKLGIGQPNVNAQTLSQITIPLPPLPEQHQIVSEIERRFSVADEVENTVGACLQQAQRLRQSILKRAFEGKLVPQNPEDEPAERLLERIKQEKEKAMSNKSRYSKKKNRRDNKVSLQKKK